MLSRFFTKARAAWSFARARREFTRLDAATYRDLGITPSEFDSYWAESQGLTEPTRQRVQSLRPAA